MYDTNVMYLFIQLENRLSQEMSDYEQKQNRDYDALRQALMREVKQLQEKQTKDIERRVSVLKLTDENFFLFGICGISQ